jgi:hypothetical protein
MKSWCGEYLAEGQLSPNIGSLLASRSAKFLEKRRATF